MKLLFVQLALTHCNIFFNRGCDTALLIGGFSYIRAFFSAGLQGTFPVLNSCIRKISSNGNRKWKMDMEAVARTDGIQKARSERRRRRSIISDADKFHQSSSSIGAARAGEQTGVNSYDVRTECRQFAFKFTVKFVNLEADKILKFLCEAGACFQPCHLFLRLSS